MKAVIMAGGEGSRLRPLTSNQPKPMAPLVNRPMMEHVVTLLRRHGFDDIVVTVAYMANAIRTYFGDGSEFGVRIQYAVEEEPMGTAGSVGNGKHVLDQRFLVISGDVLTDADLSAIVGFHAERGAIATIGLAAVENPLEYGIVIVRDDGSIERFLEKPTWGQVFSDTINTGIYVLEPEVFDHIPDGQTVDFSANVFPAMLDAGKPLFGAVLDGYWEDVGTLEAYIRAHKDALDGNVEVEIDGFELQHGVWLGEGAEIHPEAKVEGPAVIAENCRIGAGARLGEYVVLGSNVRVRENGDLERVVIHDNAYLGPSVRLRGAVIGRSSDLRAHARIEEGAVLGDEAFVGENAVVNPGVKIYPFKTVEAGAVVNASLVWETRGARSLFGRDGVAGLANVDISPELATRLAMAHATSIKKDTTIVTSRDSSRSARMLKRAMMAGLNAAGVNVLDLEVASVPVTRFAARQPSVGAGVTVRLVEGDPQSVIIRFFDGEGLDLSEVDQRRIERVFTREDFRRVLPSEIGDISYPPRALEQYTLALESTVDVGLVQQARHKVVVDYGYGSTSFVMPNVLAKLGADVLAVNPYASTRGLIAYDKDAHAEQVAALVRAAGANLGAAIDPDGEHLTIIDDDGHVLTDSQTLLVFLCLLGSHIVGEEMALPVGVTHHAEEIVERAGLKVRLTKMSSAALMEAATDRRVGFAASLDGGYILPGFLPAYDAAAALVKLLELLALDQARVSDIVHKLPRVHIVRESVVTPWDQKGTVMRLLVERTKDREVELVDGVKVRHDDGWVLALPDPSEPLTNIWAEASSDADARRLAQEYARRIRQMLR
ncbi:MAG: sugar phosphate nucleotidyltransferase [Acidimicrobiales bacterium]